MVHVPLIEIRCKVCDHVWRPEENEVSKCPNCDADPDETPPHVPKPWWKGGGAIVEKSENRYAL